MIDKRTSGILLHITSLPSASGIGDLGREAYKFANFLADARQSYWQVLPLNPTGTGPPVRYGVPGYSATVVPSTWISSLTGVGKPATCRSLYIPPTSCNSCIVTSW